MVNINQGKYKTGFLLIEWCLFVCLFFLSAGGEIVILETRPLESSWLLSLRLEKYCYNTLKWHTLIDHQGTEIKKKNKRRTENTRQRREAEKRSSKTPHGGSYRETSEGLWFVPLKKQNKKTKPKTTWFYFHSEEKQHLKENDHKKRQKGFNWKKTPLFGTLNFQIEKIKNKTKEVIKAHWTLHVQHKTHHRGGAALIVPLRTAST